MQEKEPSEPIDEEFLARMERAFTGWDDPVRRLLRALEGDELQLYMQPIANLGGRQFVMAEVLVRLREEEAKLLPPGEFLPVFEQYDMIPALDRWVVKRLTRRIAQGAPGGLRHFNVNVGSATLRDPRFPEHVAQTLREFGVPAHALCFEINESDVLGQLSAATRFGAAVRSLGCRVAIDGFGRRAATFAPLASLKVDFIKVDGSITRRLLSSDSAVNKMQTIVRVGQSIKVGVIAEFVEDADVLARLVSLGVDYVQGFGVARPAPIDDLLKSG